MSMNVFHAFLCFQITRRRKLCHRGGMTQPLTLCLFRHGRTTWNVLGKYQGQTDTDLDELGIAQARAVGARCKEMQPVALYSSDLRRCRDVAEQIHLATGLTVTEDKRLREIHFGEWSGLTRPEVIERFPDQWDAYRSGDLDARAGNGESRRMVQERISSFVETVQQTYDHGLVVAVTHGAWIGQLVRSVMGNYENVGTAAQGGLTMLTFAGDKLTLEAFNDRGHLLGVSAVDEQPHTPAVY